MKKPDDRPQLPLETKEKDARPYEELLKEIEYLRAEVDYLKKYNALVQANKAAAQKKRG